MNNLYKIRKGNCLGCNIEFSARRPPNKITYCSLSCYRTNKRPNRLRGNAVSCALCSASFYRPNSQQIKNNLCSKLCSDTWNARNKLNLTCKTCSIPFTCSPSKGKTHLPKYCSIGCRSACPEWKLAAAIQGNIVQSRNKSLNRLELEGESLLKKVGLKFYSQHLLFDKFLVDAFIPCENIAIQWDGDYWHGHSTKLKNGLPDKRQKKRMDLDKSQDSYMKKRGIKILRFWENEVNNEKEKVSATIAAAVRKTTA